MVIWVVLAGNHWPNKRGAMHAIIAGCLIHGVYLGAVFWAIHNGLPAGMSALVVGLQPLITALIAGLATRRNNPAAPLGRAGRRLHRRRHGPLAKAVISADGITPATVSASIFSVVAISTGTVWQKRFVGTIDLKAGTTLQYLGAAVLTGIFSLLLETHTIIWSGALVFAMFWLVFVLSIGAVLLLMFSSIRARCPRLRRCSIWFRVSPH